MRLTHKHVRKISYMLLSIIWAIFPHALGFWLFVLGVVALELGLRKGWYSKWCVSVRDDKIKTKLKELKASADPKAWVAQEAADRSNTALVDGFLYLFGPTIILLITTITTNFALLPKELLEGNAPIDLQKTMSVTSGWIIFLASAWMISQYISRYKKTLAVLKEIKADKALELYKTLCGPIRTWAYVLWGIGLGGYISLGKLGVSTYICSIFLLAPTFWPLVYFWGYKKAKAKLEHSEAVKPFRS